MKWLLAVKIKLHSNKELTRFQCIMQLAYFTLGL